MNRLELLLKGLEIVPAAGIGIGLYNFSSGRDTILVRQNESLPNVYKALGLLVYHALTTSFIANYIAYKLN